MVSQLYQVFRLFCPERGMARPMQGRCWVVAYQSYGCWQFQERARVPRLIFVIPSISFLYRHQRGAGFFDSSRTKRWSRNRRTHSRKRINHAYKLFTQPGVFGSEPRIFGQSSSIHFSAVILAEFKINGQPLDFGAEMVVFRNANGYPGINQWTSISRNSGVRLGFFVVTHLSPSLPQSANPG